MATPEEIPNIIAFIKSAWPVSDQQIQALANKLTRCCFPKRHLLVREGVALGMAYFIEQGMTRSFWIVDGQEITTSFSTEGSIVFSMDEVYYNKQSEEYVQAVEPLEAYSISVNELRSLVSDNIEWANWCRVIHQNEYRRLHRSHKERLTLPARERYEAFAAQFPDVSRRARLADIASYLGITPPTLSRLRNLLS